jgi:hypothetical protein
VALVMMMVLTISKVRWGASSNSIVLCCNDGGGNEEGVGLGGGGRQVRLVSR